MYYLRLYSWGSIFILLKGFIIDGGALLIHIYLKFISRIGKEALFTKTEMNNE